MIFKSCIQKFLSGAVRQWGIVFFFGLLGCSNAEPPPDFEAVRPGYGDATWDGCPEWSGSFDLATAFSQNELVTDWLGQPKPAMNTLVLDERVGAGAHSYRVQMNPDDFLAQAEQLRKNNPADYYDWRKLTLEWQKNNDYTTKIKLIESIQKLGPLLQVAAQSRSYNCKAGWMKVLEKERRIQGEEENYTRQWDLWIGRDSDGNLLLQTIVYRHKSGWTFWAAGGAGVRLIRESNAWHKIPKTSAITEELVINPKNLPPVPPPNRSPDCVRQVGDLVEYNQRLQQQLPKGVTLTRFLPLQGAPTEPCNRQVLQVGFTGGQRGASEEVLRQLKEDARVENLVLKEIRVDASRKTVFLVEYTLLLE